MPDPSEKASEGCSWKVAKTVFLHRFQVCISMVTAALKARQFANSWKQCQMFAERSLRRESLDHLRRRT